MEINPNKSLKDPTFVVMFHISFGLTGWDTMRMRGRLVLTDGTVSFVTAVAVVGLSHTFLPAMLRLWAVALTGSSFGSTSTCC